MNRVCYLLTLLILGLSACDPAHQARGEQQVSWLSPCPDFSVTGKAPVVSNAQCGQFLVKENPADPASKNISLNVLRLPAVNPVPEKDPLFVIAGGPGQSAVMLADSIQATFSDIRKNRDIIFVDQRGTGKSYPLDCNLESDASKELSPEQQQQFEHDAIKTCIEKYRDEFKFFTTYQAIADLDAVRAALGYEKINLWGGSYGSRVVLEYMRYYANHVRAGVIDGAAPVAIALPLHMQEDAMAALQAINNQCAKTPACVSAYGDIVNKAEQVSERLSAHAIQVKVPHPRTQGKLVLNLTAQDFSGVVHLALYSRDLSTLLPLMISNAAAGDYELFASFMYLAKSKSELSGINYGMHYAVVCAEDYPLYKAQRDANASGFFEPFMGQKYTEVCEQWPQPSTGNATLPADYWQPVASQLPLLILSGAIDPVTPPQWGELVASGFPNSLQVVAPGGHHIVTQEGCIGQLVALFIAHGDGKNLDTQCVKNIQPLALYIPPAMADQAAPKE